MSTHAHLASTRVNWATVGLTTNLLYFFSFLAMVCASAMEERNDPPTATDAASADSFSTDVQPAFIENEDGFDSQFLDDLVAANRFKTFLSGKGVDISYEISHGLATLVTAFASDIAAFARQYRIQKRRRWFFLSQ